MPEQEEPQQPSAPKKETKPARKRRMLLWIALAAFVALLLLVALAPSLLSTGPGRRAVLSQVNGRLNGRLDVDRWSLGWFSGFRMEAVSLKDADGRPAVEAASVTLPASVPALLGGNKALGDVQVESPRVTLVLLEDGTTNLQSIFPPSEKPAEWPMALPFDLSGKIVIRDAEVRARPWNVQNAVVLTDLNAEIDIASLSKPIQLEATASVGERRAPLKVSGAVTPVHDGKIDPAAVDGTLSVTLDGMDLGELSPLASAFGAPVAAAGTLSLTLDAQVAGAARLSAIGSVRTEGLQLSGGPLGEDRPMIGSTRFDFDLASEDGRLTVNTLNFVSLPVQAEASGWIGAMRTGALPTGSLKMGLHADLPALAALVPNSLNLQQGLTVTGGTMTLDATLASEAGGEGPRFESALRIEGLAARQGGRELSIEKPIRLDLAAAQTASGPRLDRLDLDSPFARATGSGTLDEFSMQLTSDLDALTREVGKFVALDGRAMSGAATLTLATSRADNSKRNLNAQLRIEALALSGFTPKPLLFNKASVGFKAVALLGKLSQPTALEGVALTLSAPVVGASFTADRAEPAPGQPLPVRFENAALNVNADLAHICGAAGGCGLLPAGLSAAGQISLACPLTIQEGLLSTPALDLQAANLKVTLDGKTFSEPLLQVTGLIQARPAARSIEARDIVAHTSFGDLRLPHASLADWSAPLAGPAEAEIDGTVDLEALHAAATGFLPLPPDTVLKGTADLELLISAASPARLSLNAALADLHLERPGLPAVDEKKVALSAQAQADFAARRADIASLSIQSSFLALQAKGSLSDWSATKTLQAKGTLTPDWARIAPLIAAVTGKPLQMTGRKERPFDLRLPLGEKDPAALLRAATVRLGLGIDSASSEGIEIAPLDLAISADSGKASADVTGGLLGGTLNLPLRIDATGDQARLSIPEKTALLTGVQINDALADRVLSRFSPVFARSVNTTGVVGLTVNRLNVPIDGVLLAGASAETELDLAGVAFRSEGFLGELLDLARVGQATLMKLPDQRVAVELRDGLIRQSPMALTFGHYTMTLSGATGLDGTLDMVAELPVTPGMVPDKNIYELLKDETLRVPVTGTVAKPSIGSNILSDNLDKLVRSAGRKLLEKEGGKLLEKGLKNIFK
jgi:hypothetical protein